MDKKKIDRINFLAKKQKSDGLTDDEKSEQQALRREYIDAFKSNLVSQLNTIYVVDEKGNKKKLIQ